MSKKRGYFSFLATGRKAAFELLEQESRKQTADRGVGEYVVLQHKDGRRFIIVAGKTYAPVTGAVEFDKDTTVVFSEGLVVDVPKLKKPAQSQQ